MTKTRKPKIGDRVPCEVLKYYPYGPIVEDYPLNDGDKACPIFGHDCPYYYNAEFIGDESET